MLLNFKRYKNFFLLSLSVACIFTFFILNDPCAAEDPAKIPFSKGETITYSIKKLKVKVGTATLAFNGMVDLYGHKALEIVLTSKGIRFFDEERIYLDPDTFYPLMIKRDLNIFGVKEEIIEYYHVKRGKVKIIKWAKGEKIEQVIERGNRFDNIYGFIYRYRQHGQFKIGDEFHLHLPTRDVSFKLMERKKLKVAGRIFDAYYMAGLSENYEVWFDSSHKKIPLMIDGVWGFGHTSMIMKAYQDTN